MVSGEQRKRAGTVLRLTDPAGNPLWSDLVADKGGSLFHSAQWMQALQATYGTRFAAYILTRGGRPAAGVAYAALHDFSGRRRVSLPFSDYGDVLYSEPDDAGMLMTLMHSDGLPWTLWSLRSSLPDGAPVASRSIQYKWQGIDLTPDDGSLWSRLRSMARRGVRKARRAGVRIVKAETKDGLRDWYLVHLHVRKQRHRLLAQPYAFFENIWDIFLDRDEGFLLLAVHEDRVIGGTLFIESGDACYYKFNASHSDYLGHRPNNLLLWHGMLEAKRRGARILDMGRSDARAEGLVVFKQAFGAIDRDLRCLTFLPHGETGARGARGEGTRAFLSSVTDLLVDDGMPDSVTEAGGGLLYRYFI